MIRIRLEQFQTKPQLSEENPKRLKNNNWIKP